MRILGIDYGEARTGLAVCDENEMIATVIGTVPERDKEKLADKITEVCQKEAIEKIVLGLPKNMDGSEGESAQAARAFGEMLKEKTELPLEFGDERGTTITAHGYLNNTDTRGKKRKNVVDAVAATIILEDYLRKRENQNG